jgi:hypothetical protein
MFSIFGVNDPDEVNVSIVKDVPTSPPPFHQNKFGVHG